MKKFGSVALILCMLVLAGCAGEAQTTSPEIDLPEFTFPEVTAPRLWTPLLRECK